MTFLSTLPARGATKSLSLISFKTVNFYPRSPRGERRKEQPLARQRNKISIHAPREGSDLGRLAASAGQRISIHAPREGSDASKQVWARRKAIFLSTLPARGATETWPKQATIWEHFYPRSPRGERPGRRWAMAKVTIFLSTLPARGATLLDCRAVLAGEFLSTLPARGATLALSSSRCSS